MVWIGSSIYLCSKVIVVDVNYFQNILDCFIVCILYLLCIIFVFGVLEGDYQSSEWKVEGKDYICFFIYLLI